MTSQGMNLLRIIVLCLTSVCVAQPAYSQVTVVPSKKRVVIDGKSYFLHTVKQGETLYSISRAYNIMQRDIVFHNPDAFESIRIGQELKIPVITGETPTVNMLQSAQFIYHITEKGQTVFWITQHYDITQEELYKHNPVLEHSELQAGQVITIPKKTDDAALPAKQKIAHEVHTVKRGETLFSIAKNYNADLNQVFELNPEIDSKNAGVRVGQQIKIPLPDAAPIGLPVEISKADTIIIRQDLQNNMNNVETQNLASDVNDAKTQNLASDVNNVDTQNLAFDVNDAKTQNLASLPSDCVETSHDKYRIAMLLPLFLADNAPASPPDSGMVVDSEGRFKYRDGRYWIHPRSANALEFYMGALLAVDSLKKQGLNLDVHVVDTMRDTLKIAQILRNPDMKNMDLIIGPFYTDLVNQVASFAHENRIHYVSPIAINAASLISNPYLLQANIAEINTVAPMVEHISKQENVHVTLIGNQLEADQTVFNAYLNKLKTVFDDSRLTVLQMRYDDMRQSDSYLKTDRMNVVVVPATNERFVNLIAGQLNASTFNYQINLYGSASWTKFVNLDMEYLHTLEFRYATGFYIDYDNPQVQNFLQQYRKMYHTEPTMLTGINEISPHAYQFAFLGYDLTFFFMSVLTKYGKDFGRCIPFFRMPTLQSDFHFEKIDPLSGYKNTHLDIYKYGKDYLITKESVEN